MKHKILSQLVFCALLVVITAPACAASTGQYAQAGVMSLPRFDHMLVSLLLTIVIYSLPIALYRYAIRKTPLSPKKAMLITIVYGIIAYIAMAALFFSQDSTSTQGSAIVLWSAVNYRMLRGSKK